jgi:hypothetical protein
MVTRLGQTKSVLLCTSSGQANLSIYGELFINPAEDETRPGPSTVAAYRIRRGQLAGDDVDLSCVRHHGALSPLPVFASIHPPLLPG